MINSMYIYVHPIDIASCIYRIKTATIKYADWAVLHATLYVSYTYS